MNMLSSFGTIVIIGYLVIRSTQGFLQMDNINKEELAMVEVNQPENKQQAMTLQKSKRAPIRYNSNSLMEIAGNIKHDKWYKMFIHNTIINVRNYVRLNKRGERGRHKTWIWKRKHSKIKTAVNLNNLIEVKVDKTTDIRKYNRNILI